MRKDGFTLVELLVIIGIMAAMVTMSVISVRSGQDAFRLKGATRDILAKVRYARSVALVSRNNVTVKYSNELADDEVSTRIEVIPFDDGFLSETIPENIQTLSGKPLLGAKEEIESTKDLEVSDEGEGESIVSTLKPKIDPTMVKGVRISVVRPQDAGFVMKSEAQKRSRMSIFSSQGYRELLEDKETAPEPAQTSTTDLSVGELKEVVWNSLGTTEEHTIYVYVSGTEAADGYKIHIDEMGGVKVYGPKEEIEK